MTAWSSSSSTSPSDITSQLTSLPSPLLLGTHYFITNPITGTGLSPKWDFAGPADTFRGNSDAFVVGAKKGAVRAPTGAQDVDWLYLGAMQGSLAQEIYRTATREGQPATSVSLSFPFYCPLLLR
jgi:hypothetical protein